MILISINESDVNIKLANDKGKHSICSWVKKVKMAAARLKLHFFGTCNTCKKGIILQCYCGGCPLDLFSHNP